MKKLLFLLLLLSYVNLFSQNTEGTIIYTETVKFEIKLPKGQEHLLAQMPTSQSEEKALYFTTEKSLYKTMDTQKKEEEINPMEENSNVHVKIVSGSADDRILKNFTNNKIIDQREFMGKKFLIKGNMEEKIWKVTTEQKKILNHVCQKAVLQDTSQSVIAWFTPQIPTSNGPDRFGDLPGMILELSINEGKRTIVANKIVLDKLPENTIETPKKGKKVTIEEFRKIQEEKMKEMGGSGGRVIKVEMRG